MAVLTVSACSGEDDPGTTPVQDEPATDLTISMQGIPGMDEDPATFTLTCDPVGGDLEDPEAACTALADAEADPFEPVPDDALCLQVIKGPGQITVTGTWDGDAVDAEFTRENSCESDRFDTIVSTMGLDVGT